MYAVIEDRGKQYKIKEGEKFKIDILKQNKAEIIFDKVLLISEDGKEPIIGKSYIEKARVICDVINEVKGKKILVLKYKKRKNYKRRRGHRQKYTEVLVKEIHSGLSI